VSKEPALGKWSGVRIWGWRDQYGRIGGRGRPLLHL